MVIKICETVGVTGSLSLNIVHDFASGDARILVQVWRLVDINPLSIIILKNDRQSDNL